jgi:hypothetical protein
MLLKNKCLRRSDIFILEHIFTTLLIDDSQTQKTIKDTVNILFEEIIGQIVDSPLIFLHMKSC